MKMERENHNSESIIFIDLTEDALENEPERLNVDKPVSDLKRSVQNPDPDLQIYNVADSPILLNALQSVGPAKRRCASVSCHSDHTYAMPLHRKPERQVKAQVRNFDHTYSAWQWNTISADAGTELLLRRRRFSCPLCPAAYAEKRKLINHRRSTHHVTAGTVHHCEVCGKEFTQKDLLDKHRCRPPNRFYTKFRVVVDGQTVAYKCDRCLFCTQSARHALQCFRVHYALHDTGFDLPCDHCSSMFRTSNALQKHVAAVHQRLKKFTCPVCNKRFAAYGTLGTHELLHTGERPYACHLCDSMFRQSSKLSHHLRVVHGLEKIYPCPLCGRMYFTEEMMKVHQVRHTGVRNNV